MLCNSSSSPRLHVTRWSNIASNGLKIAAIVAIIVGIILKNHAPKLALSFGGIGLTLLVAVVLYSCTSNKIHAQISPPPAGDKRIRLPPGDHQIRLLYDAQGVEVLNHLSTVAPVYYYPSSQFGKMPKPGCLVIYAPDFTTIEEKIHPGAFGKDYCFINSDWIAVWKCPADLKHIEGWIFSSKILQESVGTYPLLDDTYAFLQKEHSPLPHHAEAITAEKIRIELPPKESLSYEIGMLLPSDVHHFVTQEENSRRIAGFSSGNLFINFYFPTLEERKKVALLLVELNDLGIKAFMSNTTHHALILYKNEQDELLPPEDLAEMLQGEKGAAIKAAFQKAGKESFDVEKWAESFITCYHPISKDYIGPHHSALLP